MLSRYLYVYVTNYNRQLRRDCPEWAFILSEFHNFVIEHEIQRLQVGWVHSGVGEVKGLLIELEALGDECRSI